jgi:mRNA interferase YafQ
MKVIKQSTQFKKDLKRYKNQPAKIEKLKTILKYLMLGEKIPPEYNPHILSGKYKNHWECHIEDNFLIIWFDITNNTVKLVRLGTHHELFGK